MGINNPGDLKIILLIAIFLSSIAVLMLRDVESAIPPVNDNCTDLK